MRPVGAENCLLIGSPQKVNYTSPLHGCQFTPARQLRSWNMVAERLTPNRIDRHLLNWRFWGSVLVAEFVWCHSAMAAPPSSEPVPAFLARHCQGCHAGTKPKGNFRLDSLTPDFNDKANRERWLAVLEQVKTGTMPPKEKPRPPAQEVKAVTDWISGRVDEGRGRQAALPRAGSSCAGSTGPSTRTPCATCWAWTSI